MNPEINSLEPSTFSRSKHLPFYLLFVVIAAAWWLESNTLTAHLALSILTLLVGAVTMTFYLMPKIEFSADGSLKSYKNIVQPNELTAVRYFKFQIHVRFFTTRVIELYTVTHETYRAGIPSQISIPTSGWTKEQSQELFGSLENWLSKTNADIDVKTRQRISELASK